MAVNYPLLNGFRYSFASVTANVSANGISIPLRGLTELNYTEEISPGMVRGNRPHKVGETVGEYEVTGSMVMLKEDFEDFIKVISPPGAALGFMLVRFDMSVSFGDASTPNAHAHQLIGVRIIKAEDSASEGGDALTVSCDLTIGQLLRDGGVSAVGTMYLAK